MAEKSTEITAVVQSGYDQIAEKYLAWTENRPSPHLRYIEKLLDQASASTSRPLKLLELGCGAGVPVTKYLASHPRVGEIVANDISDRQIHLAQQRVTNGHAHVDFVAGDMSRLVFDAETFDGVAAFFSIIHLPRTEQQITMAKIYDWLKPGACIVCNFAAGNQRRDEQPQQQPQSQDKEQAWDDFLGVPMYWEKADVDGSLEMARAVGLEILEHEILDVTDGKQVLPPSDPDAAANFLWIVARKPTKQ